MAVTEQIQFNGLTLIGNIETWAEEVSANVRTSDLPGHEGVYVPDVRRGARTIHLKGSILAASADAARDTIDDIATAFSTNEPAWLYLWSDRRIACFVQTWDADFIDGQPNAIAFNADLIAPCPVWQSPAETVVGLDFGSANPQRATLGVSAPGTAPSWPQIMLSSSDPAATYTWHHYGRNLLRNTDFSAGQSATQDGVPLHWQTDDHGAANKHFSYGGKQALIRMPIAVGAGATAALYQTVPFLEAAKSLSAFFGLWASAGVTIRLSIQDLDSGGAPLGSATVEDTVVTSIGWQECVVEGHTTNTGVASVQVKIRITTDATSGKNILVNRPALTRSALAVWPGHSEYTCWVLSGMPAGSLVAIDSTAHEVLCFGADVDVPTLKPWEYATTQGQFPVLAPAVVNEKYHHLVEASGSAFSSFTLRAFANYWTP